jgi:protein TonB
MSLSGGISLDSSDGDYLPIVKVAPVYPRRAQSRGIEGFVVVEFVVTKNGSVRDPVVIQAKPEDIFNRAAIAATLKFKYKPRVVDGVAMEVAGVQNKISFEMD